jgi:hypothetical protein
LIFKLAEFIVGSLNGISKHRAFCLQPGYWTLFVLEDSVSQNLKERVDRYCGIHNNVDSIYNNLISSIRFDQVILFFP